MPHIDDLLTHACREGASDLHVKAGSFPFVRVSGAMRALQDWPRLTQEDTLTMAFTIMSNRQKQRFKENAELDVSYGVAGLGRFRCNVFQQRGSVGMVIRVIPTTVRSVAELRLPKVIEQISEERRGMVLVTGTTGSGKSTSLAAMIDLINVNRGGHIITIEDPIEFLHRDKKGFVTQREIEVDAVSFGTALRGALRQDPDVILVGEMRDLETISTAMTAAETGHLVLSTLHTMDTTETIQRVVSVFPPHEQQGIRLQLASILRAVISQRLILGTDGRTRVPAIEVMIVTPYIRECIINPEKTRLIRDAISQGHSQYGMQTFDQSLYSLYSQNLISFEAALHGASNPDEFRLMIQGIKSSGQLNDGEAAATPAPAPAAKSTLHLKAPQKNPLAGVMETKA
ncbi:MAG: type IV pilus twitching motility protein PilT [Blastocatellia bacterium]